MGHFIMILLISALFVWRPGATADKTSAEMPAFGVPVAQLKPATDPPYYRGLLLGADHPSMKYRHGQEAVATAKKFPNALQCLSFEPGDEIVSLARLNTARFETVRDLEICLQRVGNQLGDLSKVEPWLRAVGFSKVEEWPFRNWLSRDSREVTADEVAVYYAEWRGEGSFTEQLYPLNLWNHWATNIFARNMTMTFVVRRSDARVIGVDAGMIFL